MVKMLNKLDEFLDELIILWKIKLKSATTSYGRVWLTAKIKEAKEFKKWIIHQKMR